MQTKKSRQESALSRREKDLEKYKTMPGMERKAAIAAQDISSLRKKLGQQSN